jgi:hypothetical protein
MLQQIRRSPTFLTAVLLLLPAVHLQLLEIAYVNEKEMLPIGDFLDVSHSLYPLLLYPFCLIQDCI